MPDGVSPRTAGETVSRTGPKRRPRRRSGSMEAAESAWLASARRARTVAFALSRCVALPLLSGLLLGRSIVLGNLHPFGIAFVVTLAAVGRRGQALAAAVGVLAAALTSPPGSPIDSPAAVLVFVWLFAALTGRLFRLPPWISVTATMAGATTLRAVAAAFSGENIGIAAVVGAVDLTAAWVLLPVTEHLFGGRGCGSHAPRGRAAGGAGAGTFTGASAVSVLVFASLLLFGTGGLQWLGYGVADVLFRLFLLVGAVAGGVGVGAAAGAFVAVLTLLGDGAALWEGAVFAAAGFGAGLGAQFVFARASRGPDASAPGSGARWPETRSGADPVGGSPTGSPRGSVPSSTAGPERPYGTPLRRRPVDGLLLRIGAIVGLLTVQLLLAALAPGAEDVRAGIAHAVLAGAGLVFFPEVWLKRWRGLLRHAGIGMMERRTPDGSALAWRRQLLRLAGVFDQAAAGLAGDFGGELGVVAASAVGGPSGGGGSPAMGGPYTTGGSTAIGGLYAPGADVWSAGGGPELREPGATAPEPEEPGDPAAGDPKSDSLTGSPFEADFRVSDQAAGLEQWAAALSSGRSAAPSGAGTEGQRDVLGTRDAFERFVEDVRRQVCRGCSHESICWDEYGWKTYRDVLALVADAEPDGKERRSVSVSDLPPGLRQRCIQLQHFTQGVDGLLALVYDKDRTERQIRQWQAPLQRQLSGLAEVIAGVAEEIRRLEQAKPHDSKQSEARPHPRFQVHTDSVQVPGDVTVVSGDSLLTASLPDDKVAFIVCDGMGSGPRAAAESRAVAAMVRRFLEAGFDLRFTVQTINSVMLLRAAEDSFVTLDVTVVDLRDGTARIAKTGAAPTYIHRGDGVDMVRADSLPVGILPAVDVYEARLQLNMGDVVVMMSDGGLDLGASRGDKGEAVRRLLARIPRPRPKALVDGLFSRTRRLRGPLPDDITVVAVQLVPAVVETASDPVDDGSY